MTCCALSGLFGKLLTVNLLVVGSNPSIPAKIKFVTNKLLVNVNLNHGGKVRVGSVQVGMNTTKE